MLLQKTGDPLQGYIVDNIKRLKLLNPVKDIADKMGVARSKVSETLSGKRAVSSQFFEKFCTAFGLDGNYGESPFDPDDPVNIERAKVVALERKLAMVMSWVYELQGKSRSYRECLEDIDNDTTVVLTDLRRAKRK